MTDRTRTVPPDFMTVDELAEILGRDRRYVVRGIREGRLPGYWNGRQDYDIPRLAVERFRRGQWIPTDLRINARTLRRKKLVRAFADGE